MIWMNFKNIEEYNPASFLNMIADMLSKEA